MMSGAMRSTAARGSNLALEIYTLSPRLTAQTYTACGPAAQLQATGLRAYGVIGDAERKEERSDL